MSLAKKIDHIINEIYSLDEKEMDELAKRIKGIKKLVEKIRGEEEKLYYDMVNESLKDVWENEKDEAYNDL